MHDQLSPTHSFYALILHTRPEMKEIKYMFNVIKATEHSAKSICTKIIFF